MLRYYAEGSILILFVILGIFYKSNHKKNNFNEKNIPDDIFQEDWGQFVYIDQ